MENRAPDTEAEATFPPPPVAASELLVPITSWPEMFQETEITKVEFDLFWYESVNEGVAYFFRWLGEPRAAVLVVYTDEGPTHIECRKTGDELLSPAESEPIVAVITQLFRNAGSSHGSDDH